MYCQHGTLTTTKGDALPGYFVECVNSSGVVQTIYSDSSSTAIAVSSGVANRAKVDSRGNYFYYVADGVYREKYYDANGVYQFTSEPFSMAGAEGIAAAAASAASAAASAASVTSKSAISFVTDGVIFDTARGDSFTSKWTIPADATLTSTATDITFNSPATPKTLRMKLKNQAGTGDYKGTFENDWEIDYTVQILGSFSAPSVNAFDAGFVVEDARISTTTAAARISSHPGTATQLFAAMINANSQVATDSSGYTYSVGDTVRIRTKRSGAVLSVTINYNGGADRVLSITMDLGNPATDHELPRLLSTPMFYFMQGYYKITAAKVSITNPNAQLAIAGTSLAQGRYATTYANGYAQLMKAAHATGAVMVCGAPSGTSADIMGELPDILTHKPRTVLLEPFANDALATVSLATTQANVASMVAMCEAAGATPVFLNCPPLNSTYANAINTWLATTNYTYLDIYTLLVGTTGTSLSATYNSGDAIHWNNAGHLAVKTAAETWLTNLGVYSTANNTLLVDTDGTMAANSSGRTVTQSAVVTYVAAQRSGTAIDGYATSVRGTVTQATSKATGATSNTLVTDVTLNNAALAAGAAVSFTFTNSTIAAATYGVRVEHISGGTAGAYSLTAFPAAGSASITVRNLTAGSLSEAIVLRVTVNKS